MTAELGIVRNRRAEGLEFFHPWYQELLAARHVVENSSDLKLEFEDPKLATCLPFVVGLLEDPSEACALMGAVAVRNPSDYCRAVASSDFEETVVDQLLERVIGFGENCEPPIPVRVEMSRALVEAGRSSLPSMYTIARKEAQSSYAPRAALEAIALLDHDDSRFDQLLLEFLHAKAPQLVWHVVEHIGLRRVVAAKDDLRSLATHDDPILRGDAVWALGQIERATTPTLDSDAVGELLECLKAEDRHVQGHAVRTIGRLRIRR